MSEVRVQLPLGAYCGVWESLGIRLPWAQEIVSSNLTTPTALRWSSCWYEQAAVNRPGTGSIPVTAALRKGKPTGDGSGPENRRAMSLGGSTPPPSALNNHVPLAERQRCQSSKLERWVQLPQGILGDRLTVGCLPLKQAMEVQILLPEPFGEHKALIADNTAGRLLLVATPGSDPGGRWFDSNPRKFSSLIDVAR